jgi:hypothetical protein
LIKVKRVTIIIYLIYVEIVNIYVQRKDSLNKLGFEESFTRYKTHVIIACAESIYSEVIREKMNEIPLSLV